MAGVQQSLHAASATTPTRSGELYGAPRMAAHARRRASRPRRHCSGRRGGAPPHSTVGADGHSEGRGRIWDRFRTRTILFRTGSAGSVDLHRTVTGMSRRKRACVRTLRQILLWAAPKFALASDFSFYFPCTFPARLGRAVRRR
jgi:hypothetical protein